MHVQHCKDVALILRFAQIQQHVYLFRNKNQKELGGDQRRLYKTTGMYEAIYSRRNNTITGIKAASSLLYFPWDK